MIVSHASPRRRSQPNHPPRTKSLAHFGLSRWACSMDCMTSKSQSQSSKNACPPWDAPPSLALFQWRFLPSKNATTFCRTPCREAFATNRAATGRIWMILRGSKVGLWGYSLSLFWARGEAKTARNNLFTSTLCLQSPCMPHSHFPTPDGGLCGDCSSSTPLRDPLFAEFRDFAKTVLGHEWGRQGADVAETLRKLSHGPGPHSGKIWAPGAPWEATKIAKNKISENL